MADVAWLDALAVSVIAEGEAESRLDALAVSVIVEAEVEARLDSLVVSVVWEEASSSTSGAAGHRRMLTNF